ncbi:MAG: metalloregulator ArsR/SmtB family transcription factor [Phycisphaerae bacterium]
MLATRTDGERERERNREECVQLLRIVAHPIRLMILEALAERSQCVKDLNARVPISQPRLSQHMAALRKLELVGCHTNGPLRCYYLLRPTLVQGLVRLLSEPHPPQPRDREDVLREIRQTAEAPADFPGG